MGILIAIDGVDASGKQTQTEMLFERLTAAGIKVRKLSFPAYDKPSSALVKMYLDGEFGTDPNDVNAYAASALFALDRFATFKSDWIRDSRDKNTVILADRYTTSNMIHQAGKISDLKEKKRFLDWLYDFEYNICELPKPELVIFLDMPVPYARRLMESRANKIDGTKQKDIHERNFDYLEESYKNAVTIADLYEWKRISCVRNECIRTPADISDEVFSLVSDIIKKAAPDA